MGSDVVLNAGNIVTFRNNYAGLGVQDNQDEKLLFEIANERQVRAAQMPEAEGLNPQNPDAAKKAEQMRLEMLLNQEKSKLLKENITILQKGLEDFSKKVNDEIQSKIIESMLNEEKPDIKGLSGDELDISGANGGKSGFYAKVSGGEMEIIGFIDDLIDTKSINSPLVNSLKDFNRYVFAKSSIQLPINQDVLKRQAFKYLQDKNYLNALQELKNGESVVLEYSPKGNVPVVTATRDNSGNTTISINKGGVSFTVELSKDDFQKLEQENFNSGSGSNPFAA